MKIRNITLKDKKEVMKLIKELYEKNNPKGVSNWNKNYKKFISDTFLMEDKKKVVGYVSIDIRKNSIYIADLYIIPKYRKKGIATKFVKHIQNLRKKLNKRYLRVDVRRKDKPAVKLYKKLGFIILESKNINKSWRLIK